MNFAALLGRVAASLLTLAALTAGPALAQTSTTSTLVRLATTQGPIDIRLTNSDTPVTVTRFLEYVNGGDYQYVFFHRSSKEVSVIQAGGFRWLPTASNCCLTVTSRGTINNEFSASRPNVRGTVAMAKVGQDANSATSQWFINLVDNTTTLGAGNAGGFTVFGHVTPPSMRFVDRIAALKIVNAGGIGSQATAASELPVVDWTSPNPIKRSNLVIITSVTAYGTLSDEDRVLTYLEAVYADYLGTTAPASGTLEGYTGRYYADTGTYVGVKDGKVWYLSPALGNTIRELGSLADLLATAQAAGY